MGLNDPRSGLLRAVFKIFAELPPRQRQWHRGHGVEQNFINHVQEVYLLGEREEHSVQAERHEGPHVLPDQGRDGLFLILFACNVSAGRLVVPVVSR